MDEILTDMKEGRLSIQFDYHMPETGICVFLCPGIICAFVPYF